MSRSLGGTPLTTRSPILISPALTLSRPAIMASKVDLPQPEGPTSTTNSPSFTSRLIPFSTATEPKDLLRLRIVSEAISILAISERLASTRAENNGRRRDRRGGAAKRPSERRRFQCHIGAPPGYRR